MTGSCPGAPQTIGPGVMTIGFGTQLPNGHEDDLTPAGDALDPVLVNPGPGGSSIKAPLADVTEISVHHASEGWASPTT